LFVVGCLVLQGFVDKAHARGIAFGLHLMHGIPKTAVARRLPILGTNFTADQIVATPRCGNFDIILDPFDPVPSVLCYPARAVRCALLGRPRASDADWGVQSGDHGHRMLIVARLAI